NICESVCQESQAVSYIEGNHASYGAGPPWGCRSWHLSSRNPMRLKRILEKLFDENEFLSPYGIRSVSRYHAEHPYVFKVHGEEYGVHYMPGESDSSMFGGNTNWRGPIWFPINILIIRALLNFYLYYGDNLRVEFPT